MFKTIVVGVDGREGGRDALALAASLQGVFGSDLVAVHAFPPAYYLGRGADGEYEKVIHDRAVKVAREAVERAGVAARAFVVADGSPGRALHRAATSATPTSSWSARPTAGAWAACWPATWPLERSTARRAPSSSRRADTASTAASCAPSGSASTARPNRRPPWESPTRSLAAVGARLRVIDVVVPPDAGGPFPAYRPDWAEHAHIRREEAEDRVAAVLADLGDIATGDVPFGDPARELAYAAHDLDLLVTGSRGYGPVRRLMLGSTSTKLVHEAPCPVLVLTRGAEDGSEAVKAAAAATHAS